MLLVSGGAGGAVAAADLAAGLELLTLLLVTAAEPAAAGMAAELERGCLLLVLGGALRPVAAAELETLPWLLVSALRGGHITPGQPALITIIIISLAVPII